VFAVLHASPETPLEALLEVAQAFTPRFQAIGPFVLLDVGGLSALFETPRELGEAIHRAGPACRSVALASTAAAAMLLACGREGLTVLEPEAETAALRQLPIDVLVEVTVARVSAAVPIAPGSRDPGPAASPPHRSNSPAASSPTLSPAVGWRHPRDTHQAQHARRLRVAQTGSTRQRQALMALHQCRATLRRWGIHRLGALAALPRADVHARLGELGASWQRLASGEDEEPLVPWLAEPVFEDLLDLEWPIEGFEPLSFVLARLLEPLAMRLERADRGAVAIRTALHLATRQVHVRVIPLPAPMRDPKTLRTLVLLDLESHPPCAAIDRVHVRLEPTPGRVLQWALFDRAQPAPEQVATLLARLTALMGDGHVGSPALVDAWRPGAFAMGPFAPPPPADAPPHSMASETVSVPLAFRRFRLPVPVRVRVDDGRPIRVTTDRRGVTGGAIVQAAGPWRTSGEWWRTSADRESGGGSREPEEPRPEPSTGELSRGRFHHSRQVVSDCRLPAPDSRLVSVPSRSQPWDRDEWDIAMADGTVYRLFVEREVGQWFLEGVFD
jgi:protein ImuB